MKFSSFNISFHIIRTLDSQQFKKPTDIQYKAIPHILRGEDVLAIAQTGTGKTAAFAIPVLSMLHERKSSSRSEHIRCVVMAPTHELAIQITEVFHKLGKYTKVKTAGIYGGVEQDPQIEKLQKGVDVIVATPGRLFDLVSQKHLNLRKADILILDEADHMLDLGFYKDIKDLIRFLPSKRQTLFFSATIDEKIKELAYSLVNKPVRIQISPKDPVSKNVDHSVMFVEMDEKRFFLERLIKEEPERKTLVFVRTKVRAERVAKAMERVNISASTFHGGKDQREREEALRKFKKGDIKVLIATDVSARGIDIPGVSLVVNYDLPEQPESYVHRVGRTGRGREKGIAIAFCSKEEEPLLDEVRQYIGKEIKTLELDSAEHTFTIDASEDTSRDLKSLMQEIEEVEGKKKKKKKKKR